MGFASAFAVLRFGDVIAQPILQAADPASTTLARATKQHDGQISA
jgi:hypothetical protein